MNKNLKYFCKKCQTIKPALIGIFYPETKEGDPKPKGEEREIFHTFKIKAQNESGETIEKEFTGRKLECGHFVSLTEIGLTDASSENLNEIEIHEIRRKIDREIMGKTGKELEEYILFHGEQYQTLLKINSKQRSALKYSSQYVDQLRERYSGQLSDENEKKTFEQKFAHFTNSHSTSSRVIEREKVTVKKAVKVEKTVMDEIAALLKKTGYKKSDLSFKQ